MISPSLPCIDNFVIYISGEVFILPLHLNYNSVCTDMFVNIVAVFVLIFFCIL